MQEMKGRAPTAFETLKGEYDGRGGRYAILTHPYFSTGAFKFIPVNTIVDTGGFTRLVLRCTKGSSVELFSYGIGDTGAGANLATGTASNPISATDAETNLEDRGKTNEEDFAIEGISLNYRGWRISYGALTTTQFNNDPVLKSAILNGDVVMSDVSAQIYPPELVSPLSLQDVGAAAVRSKVSLTTAFNRKESDHIARFDKFPEGGANSYLMANGEPTSHNFYKLNEGFVWRQSNADTDKLFRISCKMEDDCFIFVTLPSLFQSATTASISLGALSAIWLEFTMFLMGRAFYVPSGNI
jgi:hypothetical protein